MWLDGSMTVDRLSFSGGSPLGKRGSFFARGDAARGDIDQGTRLSCYYLSVDVDRESQVRSGLADGGRWIRTCMGLFLSSGCFVVLLRVLCSKRERPFFVPSPAIRFPERAEGVKGPKR